MNWLLLKSGPGPAAFNMALDEALLENVARLGQPVLRFYGWAEPAATFGHLQKYSPVEAATALRPLIRRPTGGGLVPHDADWTYSLSVPPEHEWYSLAAIDSYRRMHAWIQGAFAGLGVSTELAPASRKPDSTSLNPLISGACFIGHEKFDLLWHGKKVAGAAQRRNKCGLLIQGSVQPPPALARQDWEAAMLQVAKSEWGIDWLELSPDECLLKQAALLTREKFSQDAYNRKR
jgi:lipoate-protein ligase A